MIEVKVEHDTVVMEYKVDEGDHVDNGDVVMMLEVMKMQEYIQTPASGVVHFVADLGNTVAEGDVLFTIEEDTHG